MDSHSNWIEKNSLYNHPHRYNNQSAKSANNPYYKTNQTGEINPPTRDYLKTNQGSPSSSSHSKPQGPYPGHPGYKHYPIHNDHVIPRTSYDEDDDTTTSGSYTIDNDDWTMDNQSNPYISNMSHNEAYC